MLRELTIRNLALIERLTLSFKPGFTALTGETGAGKSILLDALSLSLGGRADSHLVRHGCQRADVTAQFDLTFLPDVREWLEEEELLDEGEPHSLLLRRVVRADGGSQAWINGVRAPAGKLKAVAARLIDIHSQHAQQRLLDSRCQRTLLDAFGQHDALRKTVRDAWQAWRRAQTELESHQAQQATREIQLFQLRQQLDELDPLQPSAETYVRLNQRHGRLAHAQTLNEQCAHALEALQNAPHSALNQLAQSVSTLENIVAIDDSLQDALRQLNEQLVILEESARDIQRYQRQLSLDPGELQAVDAQLAEYHRLARKFMVEPEALEAHHLKLRQQYEALQGFDERLAELTEAAERAHRTYMAAAERLHAARERTARALADETKRLIRPLGLHHADFRIALSPAAPGPEGIDEVQFMMTANPGQPLQPLGKVASGGEMSRISLAIEVALTDVTGLPTLIFDEADVGIGGGTAEQVGRLMRRLGARRQVLAITHQPQVAACAHQHLKVEKRQSDAQTHTTVAALSQKRRIEELARMLGGARLTETTRRHAAEMLRDAQTG